MTEISTATAPASYSSTDAPAQEQPTVASPALDTLASSSGLTSPATLSISPTQATAVDKIAESMSSMTVDSSTSIATDANTATEAGRDTEAEEELSSEEANLKAKGLKSTHRPGFYIHINSPRRLRIQTKSKTFDLDRYCPHANADLLKWGVLRTDSTLRCGVHYWGFDLIKNGQCIAHPDETLNACPVANSEMEW